jgi:hypothetical protein
LSELYHDNVVTDIGIAEHIPSDVSYYSCQFYRLQIPVPLPGPNTDVELEIRKKLCLDNTNSIKVRPETTYVRDLGKKFDAESAMLVIDVTLGKFQPSRPHRGLT